MSDTGSAVVYVADWSVQAVHAYQEVGFLLVWALYRRHPVHVVLREIDDTWLEVSTTTVGAPWARERELALRIFADTGKTVHYSPAVFVEPGVFVQIGQDGERLVDVDAEM